MRTKEYNLLLKKLDKNSPVPYELLLSADPSKELVDEYLPTSDVFIVIQQKETVGVIVLFPLTIDTVEIKNVAVKAALQGQGIGSFLIENAIQAAQQKAIKSMIIGTANSSTSQFYLYQKLGFELMEIKKNFFVDHYAEPIFENGIQAKHMLVLEKVLR